MTQTLSELLRRIDSAKRRLLGYDMTNHLAYITWPEAERIEFDVGRAKALMDLDDAERAYQKAIDNAARFDRD